MAEERTHPCVWRRRAVVDWTGSHATIGRLRGIEPGFVGRRSMGTSVGGSPQSGSNQPRRVVLLVGLSQHGLHKGVVECCVATACQCVDAKIDFRARSLGKAEKNDWRLCEQRDEYGNDNYDQPAGSEAKRVVRLSRLDIEPCLTQKLLPNREAEQSQQVLLGGALVDLNTGGHDSLTYENREDRSEKKRSEGRRPEGTRQMEGKKRSPMVSVQR